MKLYLDDIRYPIQSGYNNNNWVVCRNDKTFKNMFTSFERIITDISFDHDIDSYDDKGNEITGYDCLKWLCNYIQDNELDISDLRLNFHSANPVGKENMQSYWNNFQRHYKENNLKS